MCGLFHFAESSEAEFSVITKQGNQCRSTPDRSFSLKQMSLEQDDSTEKGKTRKCHVCWFCDVLGSCFFCYDFRIFMF